MQPTQEQENIFKMFEKNRVIKVNAVAGSGKSSTLRMLAERNPIPSLYLCFNRANAEEASTKFPEYVDCRTINSLAYSKYGKILQHKLTRPVGTYKNVAGTAQEIAKYYCVNDFYTEEGSIPAVVVCTYAKLVVKRYQDSSDEQITKFLLPIKEFDTVAKNHISLNKKALGTEVLKLAKRLWKDRTDPSSNVLCDHSTYLKLFQLSKPVLNYEIIYLDEAQDSNATTLDIIKRQHDSKIVYVGDTYQSIYQWRGAVNAMDEIIAPTCVLSKSFRYGKEIADVATWVINSNIDVKGTETISSKVITSQENIGSNKFTAIFRTNAELLNQAVSMIKQGKNIFIQADIRGFIKKLESADNLFKGKIKDVKHEDITMFATWLDLVSGAEDDPELKRISRIVEAGQTYSFIKALADVNKKESSADIILTTAHKSKGMEWDCVALGNDYKMDSILEGKSQEEVNLFYVACTRAIKVLQLPSSLDGIFGVEV